MDRVVEQYCQDLALAGYAERTKERYTKTVLRLQERFGPIQEISREQLRAFVDEMQTWGVGISSIICHLAALVFLYRKTLGCPELVSFISYPKKQRVLPAILSLDEVQALLGAIRNYGPQTVAMVMYATGARISEALALEVTDIDAPRGVIRIRRAKGRKTREVKLSPSLLQWLRQYWAQERPPAPSLFVSRKTGRRLNRNSVLQTIRAAAVDAGIKKHITNHTLRHCFATHLLEQGTDIRVVSALLGHSHIQTTALYAQVTEKLVRGTPSPLDLLPQRRR